MGSFHGEKPRPGEIPSKDVPSPGEVRPGKAHDRGCALQGVAAEHWPDAELSEIVRLVGAENLTAWIEHLREAETSIRRHRNSWKRCGTAQRPGSAPGAAARSPAARTRSTAAPPAGSAPTGHATSLTPGQRVRSPGNPRVMIALDAYSASPRSRSTPRSPVKPGTSRLRWQHAYRFLNYAARRG